MNVWFKRIGLGLGALVLVVAIGGGGFFFWNASAFDASLEKVYDVPLPKLERSTDPAVLARGKHIAEAVYACATADCHGPGLGGGKTLVMGPLGSITGPNVSAGGLGMAYSDGELARLLRHGIKKDGRSVRFMPSHDLEWLPDSDLAALISHLRTLPPVSKANGPIELKPLAKFLDRMDAIPLDIARRIDHAKAGRGPAPSPTKEYGALLGRTCTGCHGAKLSGGPIPGAPPEIPIPSNLTPDESGLKGWTFEDFDKLLVQGLRKNGKKLDPFMPIEAFGKLDETEKRALFLFLQSLPPAPFGNR
jgi:mono/diheme cytochrome c family protein